MKTIQITAIAITALTALAGCTTSDKASENWNDPFFPEKGNKSAVAEFSARQAASGAIEDGMLFEHHFDGEQISTLGETKLKEMIAGKSKNTALKVYLNLNKEDQAANATRMTNVEKALEAQGMKKEEFAVNFGPNPKTLMPAAAGIKAMTPEAAAAAPEAAAAPAN